MKHTLYTPPFWITNLVAFCVMITLSMGLIYTYHTNLIAEHTADQYRLAHEYIVPSALPNNPFDTAVIEAKAAVVMHIPTGTVIYSKNDEVQLPLASITKLMTAVTALERVPDYTSVPLSLNSSERLNLKDIVEYTLVSSSNTAAAAIAALVGSASMNTEPKTDREALDIFTRAMNDTAKKIGMSQTYFLNPTGLDESTITSGAYGSAHDVAMLLGYITQTHPSILQDTTQSAVAFSTLENKPLIAINTNPTVERIPGLIGSKTGFTDLAGGNLAIIFDGSFGNPYAIVVLGSSTDGRFTDVETLVSKTIEFLGLRGQATLTSL